MHVAHYVDLLHRAELDLATACERVAEEHADESDVRVDCLKFAEQCRAHAEKLSPFMQKYRGPSPNQADPGDPRTLFRGPRSGPLGLLSDLHDLYLGACECEVAWTLLGQAASGLRDHALLDVVGISEPESEIQATWFKSRMKQAAPQTLVVAR